MGQLKRHGFLLGFFFGILTATSASNVDERWQNFTVPSGVDGYVFAMQSWPAPDSNQPITTPSPSDFGAPLYIGGSFDHVGGLYSPSVARWDGTNWSSVGGGIHGLVDSMAVYKGELYVAGSFDRAGSVSATNLARWNGTEWKAVGDGLNRGIDGNGQVFALSVWNGALYAAGDFSRSGSKMIDHVGRWNGLKWSPVGQRTWSGNVYSMAAVGGKLYVGGIFASGTMTNLGQWNGSYWQPIGSAINPNSSTGYRIGDTELRGSVNTLAAINGQLWAGGDFTSIGGVRVNNLAAFDGLHWSKIGTGANGVVNKIQKGSRGIYIGGNFDRINGIAATNAAYIKSGWHAFADGINDAALSFCEKDVLYVGGVFGKAGQNSASSIAHWNGSTWSPLRHTNDTAPAGYITSLASDGANIFTAGFFKNIGELNADGAAKWDGTNWSALPEVTQAWIIAANSNAVYYVDHDKTIKMRVGELTSQIGIPRLGTNAGYVSHLLPQGTKLYVSGWFDSISGVATTNLAVWDGSSWSDLGVHRASIQDMAADDQNLYVTGYFTEIGNGIAAANIARWDGSDWYALDSGLSSGTNDFGEGFGLAFSGTNLFVCGVFTSAGGVAATNLARWDGSSWSDVGVSTETYIYTLLASGTNLYVAGAFNSIGGVVANNIAAWDGKQWSALGSGVNHWIEHLAKANGRIYATGPFTRAGNKPSYHIASWEE